MTSFKPGHEFHSDMGQHVMDAEREGQEVAEKILGMANNFSRRPQEEAIKTLLQGHRTLQQATARFFLRFFEEMAKDEHGHDGRNEAAVELAKAIAALPPKVKALPMI